MEVRRFICFFLVSQAKNPPKTMKIMKKIKWYKSMVSGFGLIDEKALDFFIFKKPHGFNFTEHVLRAQKELDKKFGHF